MPNNGSNGSHETNGTPWPSVCLRNILIMRAACVGMGIDPQILMNALPEEHRKKNDRRLLETWVTLEEFDVVLRALVLALGHPSRLREVGRYAPACTFGKMDAFQQSVHRYFLRFFTTPYLAIMMMENASLAFNNNKRQAIYKRSPDGVIIQITYREGPHGQRCWALDDFLSLLFFIAGILSAIPSMWIGQKPVADVHYRVIQVPLIDMLRLEAPHISVKLEGNLLIVDGAVVGRKVFLLPDENGVYAGEYVEGAPPSSAALPALRLTQDILTPCKRTREILQLARSGEIYGLDRELPATIIELKWLTHFLFRGIERLLGRATAFEDSVRSLEEGAEISAERALSEAQSRVGEIALARNFPNKTTAAQVVQGKFRDIGSDGHRRHGKRQKDIVVVFDLVAHTEIVREMEQDERVEMEDDLFEALYALAGEYGGWLYNMVGDGALIIFTNGFGDVGALPTGSMSISQIAEQVVRFVRKLHSFIREHYDWEIRVGIHYGDSTWSPRNQNATMEATGPACDLPNRLQPHAGPGGSMASPEFVELLADRSVFGELEQISVKHSRVLCAHRLLAPPRDRGDTRAY